VIIYSLRMVVYAVMALIDRWSGSIMWD